MLIAFKSAQTKEGGPAISMRDCDHHAHVVSTIASHLCRQQHGHACCYCSASPSRGTHRHLKSLAWTAHSDLNTCEPSRNPLPPRWGVCSHYEVEMEFAAVRLPVVMALAFGAVGALALVAVYSRWKKKNAYSKVVPWATYNHYGGLQELESFGDYVVRQWELDSESAIAKTAAKAAEGYLRDPRNVASESKEIACVLVAGFTHEDENDKRICADILQELEICLVAYFSSHWHHATSVLEKVLGTGTTMKRFHRAVSTALRKYRYDRLLQSLNTKRRFYTMIEELRRIARKYSADAPEDGAVTVPAESTKRSPVILFIGGGMGAGKSTVVKSILSSSFWSGVIHDAVVVEADAFKETDVIYRHLSSMSSDDIPGTAELVHQYSTEAANSLLVSALNEGRDVVFDGTMSWEPFVLQTIDMVRDIHNRRYRMGPGLREYPDGTKVEKYWEPVDDDDECVKETKANKRHYRIEFVGVTCDAHLAVVRGLRRAIVTKRGVPVKGQLRSHKMFAQNLAKYIEVVDCARIYSTSAWNGPAELIALKDGPGMKLLVDVESFSATKCLADLNTDAGSVMELYKCCSAHNSKYVNQYWQTVVLDPERKAHQKRLRLAILDHASNTSVLLERSTSDATSDAELRSSSDEDVTTKGSSDEDSSAI